MLAPDPARQARPSTAECAFVLAECRDELHHFEGKCADIATGRSSNLDRYCAEEVDAGRQQTVKARTAADHDRITATRETLEDYTLRLHAHFGGGGHLRSAARHLADFAIGAVGITWGTRTRCAESQSSHWRLRRLAAGLLRGAVQHRPDSIYPR